MNARPLVVVLVGLIAVGKSTLARRLAAELPETILVSTDAVRAELAPRPDYSRAGDEAVYDAVVHRVAAAVRDGSNVVCDGTNLETGRRVRLRNAGDGADVLYVVVCVPEAVARERLGRRDVGIPPSIGLHRDWWHVYDDLRSRLEPLTEPHLLVDGTQPHDAVVALLRRLAARPVPIDEGSQRWATRA